VLVGVSNRNPAGGVLYVVSSVAPTNPVRHVPNVELKK